MKAEIESKFPPFERHVIRVIEERFETLARDCEHRFLDSKGIPNCSYHASAVGYCKPELCSRLKSKNQMGGDTRGEDSKN